MHRHDLSAQHALIVIGVYIFMPAFLLWLGCFLYIHRPLPPVEHVVYDLNQFSGGTGAANAETYIEQKSVVEMPPLALTLSTGSHDNGIMKIRLGIEVDRKDAGSIKLRQPVINERITMFLRQKNYSDLSDAEKFKNLMINLKREISDAAAPVTVDHIYVKQLLLE